MEMNCERVFSLTFGPTVVVVGPPWEQVGEETKCTSILRGREPGAGGSGLSAGTGPHSPAPQAAQKALPGGHPGTVPAGLLSAALCASCPQAWKVGAPGTTQEKGREEAPPEWEGEAAGRSLQSGLRRGLWSD